MDHPGLEEAVQQLSDLEVALLLSLAAREHCLIETTGDAIQDLAKDLALVKMIQTRCVMRSRANSCIDMLGVF